MKEKVVRFVVIFLIIIIAGFLYWAATTPSSEAKTRYYQKLAEILEIEGEVTAWKKVDDWENGDRYRVEIGDKVYYFCFDEEDDLSWVYVQKGEVKIPVYMR